MKVFEICVWLSLAGIIYFICSKTIVLFQNSRGPVFITQVKRIDAAVEEFENRYHYLPGDLPNAGKILLGCPGKDGSDCDPLPATAGDGIVGDPNFARALKPTSYHIPATSSADEAKLFWMHLYYAGLLPEDADTAPFGGRFIVGYADGSPFPKELSVRGPPIKGLVLLLVSDAVINGASMSEPQHQALTPTYARYVDSPKFDDTRPDGGFIRGYGASSCFTEKDGKFLYNVGNDDRDCGLIFDFSLIDRRYKQDHASQKQPIAFPKAQHEQKTLTGIHEVPR